MKKLVVSMLLALVALPVLACPCGAWNTVTVTHISSWTPQGFSPNGTVIATLSTNGATNASCASTNKNQVAVDITSSAGSYAAAVLQSAFLSGSTISVYGTGACSISSTVETLSEAFE